MSNLLFTLARLAQLQSEALDRVALHEATKAAEEPAVAEQGPQAQLLTVCRHLQVKPAVWLKRPDASAVPALLHHPEHGWGLLRGLNGQGQWVAEWLDLEAQKWLESPMDSAAVLVCAMARVKLQKPFDASNSPVLRLVREELWANKKMLVDAALGGIVINLIALATSFYSMQVYDRVVPTGASQTLLVLTLGVVFATLFELVAKRVRSGLYESLIDEVDKRLSRAVYLRFLSIRLDQLPSSVGGLAAQMRGYESVRGFLTTLTSQLMVDAPFALLFLLLIFLISGILALIPLAFFVLSVCVGLYYRARVEAFARKATSAGNRKTGLLVEAVEGAETIKSGQGGWRMLSRWMQTTDEARDYEMQSRAIQEHAQHLMGSFQQISYVIMVASGALMVSKGDGLGDLLIASPFTGQSPGQTFVVYGKTDGAAVNFNAIAAGTGGFVINAAVAGDQTGQVVSSAGDVNGDGLSDLLISAPTSGANKAVAYVIFGGTSQATTVDFLGGNGNDVQTGSGASETFVGGTGNDTMVGNGGADVMYGGAGNDIFVLNASNVGALQSSLGGNNQLARVNGGTGIDTIQLSGGVSLNLTAVANQGADTPDGFSRINSVEVIDLKTDTSANTLTLTAKDVIDMSGMNLFNGANTTLVSGNALASTVGKHQVVVYGDALDTVNIGASGWTNTGSVVSYGGHNLVVYNNNTTASQLLIEQAMVSAGHVL